MNLLKKCLQQKINYSLFDQRARLPCQGGLFRSESQHKSPNTSFAYATARVLVNKPSNPLWGVSLTAQRLKNYVREKWLLKATSLSANSAADREKASQGKLLMTANICLELKNSFTLSFRREATLTPTARRSFFRLGSRERGDNLFMIWLRSFNLPWYDLLFHCRFFEIKQKPFARLSCFFFILFQFSFASARS